MQTTFPAEWAPQARVIIAFPHSPDWANDLEPAARAMRDAIKAIAGVCPVTVLDTGNFNSGGGARDAKPSDKVLVRPARLDDSWVRDFGPITVFRNGRPVMLDFEFNGWGGKFDHAHDNLATRNYLMTEGYGYEEYPFILEGGSVESDGLGTLLTTTTCLLSEGRNGWTTRAEAEEKLRGPLGADRFLWLEHGHLEGDDTDAHVDTLARFLDTETIAYVRCDDPTDDHYPALAKMEAELRAFRTRNGAPYRLLPLPWPPAVYSKEDGHRLPATYANFLISNGTLFLPTYFSGAGTDAEAIALLEAETPYRIVAVDCRPFIGQHGSLHCLTMQIPAT